MCDNKTLIPVDLGDGYNLEGRYYITFDGKIYSCVRGKFKKLKLGRRLRKGKDLGYKNVKLYTNDGISLNLLLHRVVLESYTRFILPEDKYFNFDDYTVDHVDFNPNNNHLQNLRWMTKSENTSRQPGNINDVDTKTRCEIYRDRFENLMSYQEIADKYNRDSGGISRLLRKPDAIKYCNNNGLLYFLDRRVNGGHNLNRCGVPEILVHNRMNKFLEWDDSTKELIFKRYFIDKYPIWKISKEINKTGTGIIYLTKHLEAMKWCLKNRIEFFIRTGNVVKRFKRKELREKIKQVELKNL